MASVFQLSTLVTECSPLYDPTPWCSKAEEAARIREVVNIEIYASQESAACPTQGCEDRKYMLQKLNFTVWTLIDTRLD